ncbi:MAG: hypothetical protein AB7I30_07200 [Isosphaeraceae bacterium]
MNPKTPHLPVSSRARCPVCRQPVYSRSGIHPQCAVRRAEAVVPAKAEAGLPVAEAPDGVSHD